MKSKPSVTAMICKAIDLKKTIGVRAAAGYLRNRGFSLEWALSILS